MTRLPLPTLAAATALLLACAPAASAQDGRGNPIETLIFPSQQVTLSAPIDAILKDVAVAEGEFVKKGALLATMDDRLQKIEVQKAELNANNVAPLEEAELILAEQQNELERAEDILDQEAGQEWEVRKARVRRDQAEVRVDNIREEQKINQAEVALQKQLLDQYDLLAPFDAVVLRRNAEPGATLQRGDEVVSLIKLHPLKAEAQIPVQYYDQLRVGQDYPFTDATLGFGEIRGELTFVAPLIDSASNTFRCVFEIDNPELTMPAGFEVFLNPADILAGAEAEARSADTSASAAD